jgi:predicted regulator of Ras-like GTPase activity (Roadblock/LC7/MglB family)
MCVHAVDGMARALLTNDCITAAALADAAAWAAQAADSIRGLELRAVTIEGERDGLVCFKEQLVQENGKLVQLQQKMQQRHKEVEQAMLASVNDVQQLSQQMGSLLNLIRTKDAENSDLFKQTARLKQHLAIQNDLRLQIEGQKQRLLQYQLLERESLQLKVRCTWPPCSMVALMRSY